MLKNTNYRDKHSNGYKYSNEVGFERILSQLLTKRSKYSNGAGFERILPQLLTQSLRYKKRDKPSCLLKNMYYFIDNFDCFFSCFLFANNFVSSKTSL